MMKRSKLLPLFLALILCLPHSVLAAEGERKVVVDGCFQITMDGFLRVETNRYGLPRLTDDGEEDGAEFTFYVVKDNSTVTVEAAPGYRYAEDYFDHEPGVVCYAPSGYIWLETNQEFSGWGVGHLERLTGPLSVTVSPSETDSISFSSSFPVTWICESDLARLTPLPYRGVPNADPWAHYAVEQSFHLGLFPEVIDPFEHDCTREMTSGELDSALLKLYQRLGGPASDLSHDTTLSPDDPITREQAAVRISQVYTLLGYDISPVEATDFDDDDQISAWAKSAVNFLDWQGVVEGVSFWTFAPQKTLTLQEGMTMIQRALDDICFDRYWGA